MSIMTASRSSLHESSDSEEDLEALLEASSKAFALKSQQRRSQDRKMFEEGDDLIQFNQTNPSSKSKGKAKATDDAADR